MKTYLKQLQKLSLINLLFWQLLSLPSYSAAEYWQVLQTETPLPQAEPFSELQPDRFRHFIISMWGPRYLGLGALRLSQGPIWQITPNFSLGVLGDLIYLNPDGQSPTPEYRFSIEPGIQGQWTENLHWRNRHGLEYRIFPDKTTWRYRTLFRVQQTINQDWGLYTFNEIFYDLNQGFNQNRSSLGLSYRLTPDSRIELGYLARVRKSPQAQWSVDHVLTLFITLLPAPAQDKAPTKEIPHETLNFIGSDEFDSGL